MATSTATTTTTTTMTGLESSSSRASPKRRTRLTNTNTDLLCCDATTTPNKNGDVVVGGGGPTTGNSMIHFFRKSLYRMNLWTGLYMLNPYERATFHIVGWVVLVSCSLYVYGFWKGFKDGLFDQDHSYSSTA